MVGYLTIAMAKTVQIHICHILASIGWHLLWPWCQNNLILQKKLGFSFLAEAKKARVHFIPDLKVGVFVTLRTPFVIKGVPEVFP
jgi:hypothetical protein